MQPLYVKNPNYNPLDMGSKRYVTDAEAVTHAQTRANDMNSHASLFPLLSGIKKTYSPTEYHTPLQTPAPQVLQSRIPNATPVPPISSPVAPTQPLRTPVPTQQPNGAVAPVLAPPSVPSAPSAPATPAPVGLGAPQAPQTALDIAKLAQEAGKAGMSASDFMSFVKTAGTLGSADQEAIRTKLGIPNLVDEAFKRPDRTLQSEYTDLYNIAGLGSIRAKIEGVDKTIREKREALTKASGEVNSNVWISQGTRAGRLKNLQELAYADIQNDIDSRQQYMDLYDSGVSDIEKELGFITTDRQEKRQLTVDQLNFALNEAERLQGAKTQDTITQGLRSVPEYLKGVLSREETAFQRELGKTRASKSGSGYGSLGSGGNLSAVAKAVLEAPELLQNYTPTVRGQIVSELVNAGYDVGDIASPKLGAAQREQLDQFDNLIRQAQEAGDTLNNLGLNTGFVASRGQKLSALFGGSEGFTQYRSTIDNMGSTLLRLRSGVAVTPQEFERIKGFIPSVNDDETTANTKISLFYEELAAARQNYVKRQTQTTKQIKKSVESSAPTGNISSYIDSLNLK